MQHMNKKVLLWIPLPPGTNWRGEGIAQTIENILNNIEDIQVDVLVSRWHYSDLKDSIKNDNINIIPLTFLWIFFGLKPKKIEKFKYDLKKSEKILSKVPFSVKYQLLLNKLKIGKGVSELEIFKFFKYTLRLKPVTYIYNIFTRFKYTAVWVPTPMIQFTEKLRGNVYQSFWDGFTFEYIDFSDITTYQLLKFKAIFNNNSKLKIITQSNHNKVFLKKIFNIDSDRVIVALNGSPNYREYKIKKLLDRKNIIDLWGFKSVNKNNYFEFVQAYKLELENKARLYRLTQKTDKDTKILMVSTQYRVYKGFEQLFRLIDSMLADRKLVFIFTAKIPKHIRSKYDYLMDNIFEIVRVSNKQHALLYQLSNLALHPSFAEGGHGSYPQFESASLDVPCLTQRGRHTKEMNKLHNNELDDIFCDFANITSSKSKIYNLLDDEGLRLSNIKTLSDKEYSWNIAAEKYRDIFLGENK